MPVPGKMCGALAPRQHYTIKRLDERRAEAGFAGHYSVGLAQQFYQE